MRNKSLLILSSLFVSLPLLSGCQQGPTNLSFERNEYCIYSGDKVTLEGNPSGVTYKFYDKVPNGLTVDAKTGLITYENIPNYTQVLYTAVKGNIQADPVVLTLLDEVVVPELTFVETTDYICHNNYIYATSSTNSSIRYSLKNKVAGVHIDQSTGLVTFTGAAKEGDKFTVVISSNGATEEKEFTVAKEHLVKVIKDKQATELNNKTAIGYDLDLSNVDPSLNIEVTKLISSRHVFGSDSFVYDSLTKRLTVKKNALENLQVGENVLTIVTNRNMINVTVIIANKIIKNATDLVSIGKNQESLAGYYILGNDIDLTDYLSAHGEGYNNGLGWTPIGIYHDVTDGTAFNDTFKGTFDGNGHVISGYKINRRDELGFNAGLFGYVYNLATIKNLGLISNNDNTTASFAGALAGFNEGKIINCWTNVNVSNNYGGNSYRIIGGFVGRNMGTIENCYALGTIQGESQIGAFVGLNEGTIRNCYATKEGYSSFTTGLDGIDCTLFESKADLIAHKIDMNLPEQYWDITGDSYPTLKSDLKFYYPYSISLQNDDVEYVKGDTIELDIAINPSDLKDEYLSKVTITTDDEGCVVDGNKINTSNATKNEINVTIAIDDNGLELEDTKTFYLYSATESIKINNSFNNNKVEPGERYKLSALVTPSDANQNVRWSFLPENYPGVSISGDELIISEEASRNTEKNFTLVAESSGLTDSLELSITTPNYLNAPVSVIYADDTNNPSFTLPEGVNLAGAKLYLYGNEVEYTTSGQTITISKEIIQSSPDIDLGFRLVLADGEIYRMYATYISHNRYAVNNIPADAIAISSKEDFYKYFNAKTASPTKYEQYYSKTFYLTADIDFGGDTIYGIGYTNEDANEYREFTGKIFGLGHTIKNAVITDNEKYLTLKSSEKQDQYRASRYGVGFFGAFNGECYDIMFENIKVSGNSWIGAFAGTMSATAICENVSFVNSEVKNSNGVDYSIDSLRTGKFTAMNSGKILACSFNGSILGLVG